MEEVVEHACPGAGACGGMFTANTMAAAIETLGMTLPMSSSIPAVHPGKLDECEAAGRAMLTLLERNITPRQIMTRRAFENAIRVVIVLGGSTNAVLHLMAMARAAGVPLSLERLEAPGRDAPRCWPTCAPAANTRWRICSRWAACRRCRS